MRASSGLYTLYYDIERSRMFKVKMLNSSRKGFKKRRLLSSHQHFFSPVLHRHGSRSTHSSYSVYWILRKWYFENQIVHLEVLLTSKLIVVLLGKTTTILSLLKRLPQGYNLCLLKNEFGDTEGQREIVKLAPIQNVLTVL
jgi:hypothetical protein